MIRINDKLVAYFNELGILDISGKFMVGETESVEKIIFWNYEFLGEIPSEDQLDSAYLKYTEKTKANKIRELRNALLLSSDWTQVLDSPVNQTAWATYRQQLRDISSQAGFPWEVQWPTQP
jgi:hypothetical protein